MIKRVITTVFLIGIIYVPHMLSIKKSHGPRLDNHESTSCEQFSQFARFNPNSILDSEWMVFYYWGPPQSAVFYWFHIPAVKHVTYLKEILDDHVRKPINWSANLLLMRERNNVTSLLVERGERGEYDLYIPYGGLEKDDFIEPIDVRFKQTGDNLYIGFMLCKEQITFVMSRIKDVPPKNKIQDAAARLGYRGRGGKSYLYQGHQWMPIPEASDHQFWKPSPHWYLYE